MSEETSFDELRTASEAPSTIHLNIGMQGKLYTYHLEQAKPARKKRGPKPKIKLKSKPKAPSAKS